MTDVVNLNSIRSDSCDCNKPKKTSCGCHNQAPQPCYLGLDLSSLYFKVKNLFSELKSEWQRAEARSNLGVTDIIDLKLTEISNKSGGVNKWTMEISKGGSNRFYDFIVTNGQLGESATVEIAETETIDSNLPALVINLTNDLSHLLLKFRIPRGEQGEKGDRGYSVLEMVNMQRELVGDPPFETLGAWIETLKGAPGEPGPAGPAGEGTEDYKIDKVSLVGKSNGTPTPNITNGDPFTGDYLTWQLQLKNGEIFPFWVPYSVATGGDNPGDNPGGSGSQEYRYNVFIFKKLSYTTSPSVELLAGDLAQLVLEVSNKSVATLTTYPYAWSETAPVVLNPGLDYIFMATCIITNGNLGPWSVICLTGSKGKDGTDGIDGGGTSGKDGQFTSVVFTRTNLDISGQKPLGGSYTEPYPRNMTYLGRIIVWEDGIPEERPDGEENLLWASSSVFKSGDTTGDWTYPTRMTDTTTYDVEFSPIEENPGDPTHNPHNWYDPSELPNSSWSWSDIIWRAERECKNGVWGDWYILKIKGEQGEPGTGSGTQGEKGEQGLMGPIIRMFIYDPEHPDNCYYNQTNVNPTDPLQLRYIDVVYYDDPNNSEPGAYYMPTADTNGSCVHFSPNSNDWTIAQGFSFAYIQTLITNQLSSYTIDTSEIRIHSNPADANSDCIVAGMTSGKPFANTPVLNIDNEVDETDPIRIWAGNPTPVTDDSMDLMDAPFRVTEKGVLFASNADIEGTVQANILRLGKDSFSVCESGEYTIGRPLTNDTLFLPKLVGQKVLMFYLLTDKVTTNIRVLTANNNDKLISFNPTTQTLNTPSTSIEVLPKRLYQLFGIDHEWRVCEVTLAPITAVATTTDGGIVDPSYYSAKYYWTIEDYIVDVQNSETGRLGIKGQLSLEVTNNYTSDITLHISDLPLRVIWKDTLNYEVTYTMHLLTNGLIAPVGLTTLTSLAYDRELDPPCLSGNGFEVELENLDNLGGLTSLLYAQGPTVSIISDNIGEGAEFDTSTFLLFVGNTSEHLYKYKLKDPLISATYHRAPGQTTLNALNPAGNNNTNEDTTGETTEDGVVTEVTDFYHYFKPALTVWDNKKVGFDYEPSGEFRDYDAKLYNATRDYPIQVTFPKNASIYFYIAGDVQGVEKVMYGGELMLDFHDSINNSEVNLDNYIIPTNTNEIDYEFGFYDTPGESDDPSSLCFRRYFSQAQVGRSSSQRFYSALIFTWPRGKIKNYNNPYIYGYSVVKYNVEMPRTLFEATYTDVDPEKVSLPQIKAYKWVPKSTFYNLINLTQQNN